MSYNLLNPTNVADRRSLENYIWDNEDLISLRSIKRDPNLVIISLMEGLRLICKPNLIDYRNLVIIVIDDLYSVSVINPKLRLIIVFKIIVVIFKGNQNNLTNYPTLDIKPKVILNF